MLAVKEHCARERELTGKWFWTPIMFRNIKTEASRPNSTLKRTLPAPAARSLCITWFV
jgi:hypothetical protein